jgi:hypothetical protein
MGREWDTQEMNAFQSENLKGKGHLRDQGIDGRITLT